MGGKGKQNAEKEKKIENIKWQINDVIWQIQELKSTTDVLKNQAAFAYDRTEDSGSDKNALVAQGTSLRKTAGGEKKLVQELKEAEKNWESNERYCNILLRKKDVFLAVAFVKFVKINLTGYNIWIVAQNALIFVWFHWYKILIFF